MSGKTIFVTGGSGYVGQVLIEEAITQGYAVTALSRAPSSDATLSALGATPVRGDIKTLDVLTREAGKADITINIADVIAGNYSISQDERWATNFAAHDALAAGLKGTDKPLIITSGTLVTPPHPEDEETDEASPGWPEGHMFKRGFEDNRARYVEQGVKVSYLRLAPWVYGRGGSGVKMFMDMWGPKGTAYVVKPGTAMTSSVHVEDAARLYLLVAEKGKMGESYNCTSETDVTQRSIAEAVSEVMGIGCEDVDAEEAREKMGPFLGGFLSLKCRASSKKAREELGWKIEAKKGLVEEINTGSYKELAEKMKKGSA